MFNKIKGTNTSKNDVSMKEVFPIYFSWASRCAMLDFTLAFFFLIFLGTSFYVLSQFFTADFFSFVLILSLFFLGILISFPWRYTRKKRYLYEIITDKYIDHSQKKLLPKKIYIKTNLNSIPWNSYLYFMFAPLGVLIILLFTVIFLGEYLAKEALSSVAEFYYPVSAWFILLPFFYMKAFVLKRILSNPVNFTIFRESQFLNELQQRTHS